MTIDNVPLARPSITEEEISIIGDVLRSGWLAHGPYNKKFETLFAEMVGVKHAITMNSCTSALEVALKVKGITGEVIVPSFTWVASANTIVTSGATPVFCEVNPATRNVTAETIAAKITPQTEAVMIVHYGGQACNMDDIMALCDEHGLYLIEDSAETLGGGWNGQLTGSFGVGCFSFFPTKNITTGEGGMFTTNDDEINHKARALIAHGISSTTFQREKVERPWLRAAEIAGHNYRMPNPLAALGYHQIQRLDEMNEKRVVLAELYNEKLASLAPDVETPFVAEGANHVYQMYTICIKNGQRDFVVNELRSRGVGASVHFDPPVHMQPYYMNHHNCYEGMLPETEKLVSELVTLPIFPDMTVEELDFVVDTLTAILSEV